MKTIDINLLGNVPKVFEKSKTAKTNSKTLDPKTKIIAITLVVGSCIVFLLCDAVWFFAFNSTQKANLKIKELKVQKEKLNQKITQSSSTLKDLQNQEKILKLKLLAKNQVQNTLLPWQKIMENIASAVPKDIKITDISKEGMSDKPRINITGQINSFQDSKFNPLETISFFALNLGETTNYQSILTKSSIKKIEYKKENSIYEFMIETQIRTVNNNPALNKNQKKVG